MIKITPEHKDTVKAIVEKHEVDVNAVNKVFYLLIKAQLRIDNNKLAATLRATADIIDFVTTVRESNPQDKPKETYIPL